jgi:hypothetical protein
MGSGKGSVEISERSCADEGKRPVDTSERIWADESGQCGRKEWPEMGGRKARWRSACVDARKSANGVACKKWREMAERKARWR